MTACCDEFLLTVFPGLTGDMDLELLRRWVLGECDAGEREEVARWLAEDRSHERLVEVVRRMSAEPGAWTQSFDAGAAWSRVSRVVSSPEGERVVRVRTPGRVLSIGQRGGGAGFSGWRVAAWGLVAAAAIALGSKMAWGPLSRALSVPPASVPMREVIAARGQRAQVRLVDGTRVELAAGSRLTYPAAFTDSVRAVSLEGEAYFEVEHDARRPFLVRTRGGVTEDVGTSFVVRQYASDARLEVVVASGTVAVRAPGRNATTAREVGAGQLVRLDSSGGAEVRAVDLEQYLAWMHGRLVFRDTPFREVLAQLARWYDADFELADSTLASRRFTGAFQGESLDQIVSELAPPMHVRYERRGRTIVFSRMPGDR
jgi:transmembrane sensor